LVTPLPSRVGHVRPFRDVPWAVEGGRTQGDGARKTVARPADDLYAAAFVAAVPELAGGSVDVMTTDAMNVRVAHPVEQSYRGRP